MLDCIIKTITPILSKQFKALPPGSSQPVDDVAWVSCRGELAVTVLAQERHYCVGIEYSPHRLDFNLVLFYAC